FDDVTCDCETDAHCDDDNVCTDDTCNAGSCENTNNTATCDDENACTSADVCGAGLCGGTNNTDSCNDNDVCTITDACGAGACSGTNVCFDCTVGGNLLTNCDFSDGTTGWPDSVFLSNGTVTATGTQSVVDGRLEVYITNGGVDPWQVQPRQEGLALVAGEEYVVKFNAMASVARTMELSITQDGGAYASYSNQPPFNLTTEMQLFTFEFTMVDPLPAQPIKWEIKLGGTVPNATLPNTVTFDNMFIAPKP
ncbi:MAG TPA: carbohydrate binding domain-containing protein, partial [Polyangiaceae bacterium]|nr:carbohydrate binding domain-containing protein [Polyangiaceae bacterium]